MRLKEKFETLKSRHEGALISYITLGDPSPEESLMIAQSLIDSGNVDVLELGVPFSDPIADGPVIQAAVDRALKAGMNTDKAFEIVERLDKKVPIVYLTYYNIVLQYGVGRFIKECARTGVAGLIIADLPYEESGDVRALCKSEVVDYINIVTPNTSPERMSMILDNASGFVYLVSTMGVTGARESISKSIKQTLDLTIKCSNGIPVAVGFGISRPEQVQSIIGMGADGAIVGSAIVDRIGKGSTMGDIIDFLKGLKSGTSPLKAMTVSKK
ncbi:tryptophan synthase subunit alpha [Methanocella sp. CWC-04]|uniref:Tryptophan synthase alpha chain n=1 Tax=Methanooceanicella nereidis TaxID=2052831 RepID=A0AAP2W8N2_9EURY|nr:tryptophan synthase subunit alpha [Methanocella sp. CWC-04]MCD1296339.1 tryptophan synthase subunit alpha [Methanocella sp. CWC-04]